MDRALYTEKVKETLKWVFAHHLGEVYDDPFDADAGSIGELEAAGAFLGIDIWDQTQLRSFDTGWGFHDFEHARLKEKAARA